MTVARGERIVIADDHPMFRQGLKVLLEAEGFDVVGEAENGQEAIHLSKQHRPQVAVLDYSMPVLNGIDAARQIHRESPQTMVVLLTMYDDKKYALDALRCAIRGFVLKNQAAADLITAIREVLRGSIYLSPGISAAVIEALTSKNGEPGEQLTDRQRQVLQLIAEGNSTRNIADLLHVSVKTAENHRSHLMRKLDVHNVAGLVRYSIRQGIIQA